MPLYVNASWLILAVLVTLFYGQRIGAALSLAGPAAYLVGLALVLCLLLSVLLHELGHALTARRYGIGVRGITLELLGGYTEMDREAPSPKVELLVSLAGPAVSAVLGLAAALGAALAPRGTALFQVLLLLALSNLVVAVFNALPGLPLDGGRALRAAVWAGTGNRHQGTAVAGWTGRVVAASTGLTATALLVSRLINPVAVVFTLLVAMTLWQGATQAIRLGRAARRFPLVDLATLTRPLFGVPSGTPLAEAQRRAAESGATRAALAVVDSAGRPVALVQTGAAEAVPVERRPWIPVDSVARDTAGMRTLPTGLRGEDVVRAVQADPGAEYLVTTGEDVVGVLHVADLAELLEPKGPRR